MNVWLAVNLKNMKNILFTLIFLFISQSCLCQPPPENNNPPLTQEELLYATTEFNKFLETDLYKKVEKRSLLYVEKMNGQFPDCRDILLDTDATLKWIESIIHKTNFKSFDEAKAFFEETERLDNQIKKEYKVLFDIIAKAGKEDIKIIHKKYHKRVKENFGF